MNNSPLVSVIVTCFNKGNYIKETSESILAQTYPNFEIVIVNDGSTDNSKKVLDEIKDPKVKVYHTSNKGVVAARNTAVLNSYGKYILPVDGDDLISVSYLEEAVDIMEKNINAGIVYCDVELFGEDYRTKWDLKPYSLETILETNPIHVSALCRREDYDKIGGWKSNTEYFYEDWDFFLSIIELGRDVFQIPKVLFYYRMLPDSRTKQLEPEKTKKALKQIYLNHLELYAKHFEDPLNLKKEIHELKKVEDEYKLVINSLSYKIGRLITFPFRLLRKLKNH
jgi:glycosyltransferase involved in cell wall biosynthesis